MRSATTRRSASCWDLYGIYTSIDLMVPLPTNTTTLTDTFPNDPTIAGAEIYAQVVLSDSATLAVTDVTTACEVEIQLR